MVIGKAGVREISEGTDINLQEVIWVGLHTLLQAEARVGELRMNLKLPDGLWWH